MRVLVANIPLPTNRFLIDLNEAISQFADVVHSSDLFWRMEGDFDVVHLHFPHYLTFEVERASQTSLTEGLSRAIEQRMHYWASHARIVITRHVLLPHDAEHDSPWEALYERVYSYCDAVVHFANASVNEFRDRYSATKFFRGFEPIHKVIPHQNYASLPNTIGKDEARDRLGLPRDAKVLLVFGAIRSDEERALVINSFRRLQLPGKVLLASSWRERLPNLSWIRLKYWIRDLKRVYFAFHRAYHFNYGFVAEEGTQTYLNAADVLFIPRFRVLNSGNVTLGMTFGRVVVGPDSWNVGELLKGTGNPVFDPGQPDTAIGALQEGFRLAEAGEVGHANRELALSEWEVSRCARSYASLFNELIFGSPPSESALPTSEG
jgi:glycosyltransferase involved in cell wall biosynthesis